MNRLFFLLILLFIQRGSAQISDTILDMVISKPFFYNVINNKDGHILTGSSDGIYEWVGNDYKLLDPSKGYVTLDQKGRPVILKEGINKYNEKSFLYLLPYPEMIRDEYHASGNGKFFIVSGGRLYIYDIVPYRITYQNHSVRTISQEITGTYSGIYCKGRRLGEGFPLFSDGYVRKIGDRHFLCSFGLVIIDRDTISPLGVSSITIDWEAFSEPVNDILLSEYDKQYYLSGESSLFQLSADLKSIKKIYQSGKGNKNVTLIGQIYDRIYFSAGNNLLILHPQTQKIDTLTSLQEPVISGFLTNRQTYLLGANGLYAQNSENDRLEKIVSLEKAHSLVAISGSEIAISSDNGLFLYNTVSRILQPLIPGVEFNRRALFIDNNVLRAGSINGLYSIRIQDFATVIAHNTVPAQKQDIPFWTKAGLAVFGILAALLGFLFYKTSRRLKKMKEDYEELSADMLTREKIESYIRDNLAIASLKTITEYFDTNNSRIYNLLVPDKPGNIIQQLRFEKIQEMNASGASASEMAEVTGLSESYIRKVRSKE